VLDNQASRKKQNVNPKARVVEMDVTSPGIDGLFGSERFEMVNHHAAQVSVSASVADPQFDARVNIMGALNLLGASAKHGVRKFIFASSGGTVYGATDKLPATEDLPFAAASPYGVSKVATELYLRIFAEQRGLRYTALRYSNVYGPRQDPHGEAGVVAIFTEKMFTGGRPVICVNIGTGRRTSTNQLFSMLKKLTGYPGPEEHGSARAGDLRDSCLAVAKAARVLGWEPRVQMEEGLRQTVDWFRSKPGAI
jgi:UDP-glucose 4-epimerase